MTTYKRHTKESIQKAVNESVSIAGVIRNLGLIVAGGNYDSIRSKIEEYDIDTSHFSGKLWNKGKKVGPKRRVEEYLNNKYKIKSYNLKKRLIAERLRTDVCEICNINSWLGKKLALELDHIDGNHNNNNLSNLRIICPNCHSQTDNFRGKNIRKNISQ